MKELFFWYRNNPIAQYEGYYASVFYSYFAALGLDIILEDTTNQGRIDMTVKFNEQVYLFEFKVVEIVPVIGVEFSKKSRSVVGFDWLSI